MRKINVLLSVLMIASLLAAGLSLAFPSSAMAMEENGAAEEALSKAFKAEQKWLGNQQQAINKADQAALQIRQLIDKASAEGLDVTILQNALAAFNSEMAAVKSGHQTAADILAAHNGFDDDGSVTDQQSARVTVLDARQALSKAHVTMTQAVRDLRQAARDWRQVTFPQDNPQG
jgi:hypothetical protein